MNLLIVAPDGQGHQLALYTRRLALECLGAGWRLHLATTERATTYAAFATLKAELGERLPVTLMGDAPWPEGKAEWMRPFVHLKRHTFHARMLRDVRKTFEPDALFLTNIDEIDLALALRGSPYGQTPFTGFLMRRNFYCHEVGMKAPPPRPRDKVLRPAFHRMLQIPTLPRVLFGEESMRLYAEKAKYPHWEKVQYVPELAYLNLSLNDPDPRRELGLSDDAFVILTYGSLTARKGTAVLLEALAKPECPKSVQLLVVGKADAATEELLSGEIASSLKAVGRLHLRLGFASDLVEQRAFRAADAVWLGYQSWYGMSGVLVQAALVGKPVLATDEGIVGWMTDRYGLGLTLSPSDAGAAARAIARLHADPAARAEFGVNGRRMAAEHTPEKFGARVREHLEACVASRP